MDWTIFHALNSALRGHDAAADVVADFASWCVPLLAAATVGLWLFARPGGSRRWKLACASALGSAGLALLVNQIISHAWVRERPFLAHPRATLLLASPSHDPSFPSDHAAAAFAIAFAVLFFSRRAGIAFLVAAVAIAFSRIFVGLHYPGDVGGGALVGLVAALVVAYLLRPAVAWLVGLASRVTDPLLRPVWDAVAPRGRSGAVRVDSR